MLEPYERKLSRTVLRGERESNLPDLLDRVGLVYGGSLNHRKQNRIRFNLIVEFYQGNITTFYQTFNSNSSTKNWALGNCPTSHPRTASCIRLPLFNSQTNQVFPFPLGFLPMVPYNTFSPSLTCESSVFSTARYC
jgi:hypothetical protein